MNATSTDRLLVSEILEILVFLPSVCEFVEFLSVKDHTLDEVLAHMVLRVLAPLDTTSAFVSELNSENIISDIASFGIGRGTKDNYPGVYDLRAKYPLTDAIRNRSVVWINTLPQWPDEYPLLKDLEYKTGEKTFFCFPIEKCGTPIAVIGIFGKSVIHPDAEITAFLKAIGNIFALQLFSNKDAAPDTRSIPVRQRIGQIANENTKLTERQSLILKMMSEGRTNSGIGELLGYSESTIRQETIRIFATLNCHGREEASEIYREKRTQDSKVAM